MSSCNLVSWIYVMVTFWFQVCEGECFCPWSAKFQPSPLCSHPNFTTFSSRRGLHPFVSSVHFGALLWRGLHPFTVEPNPTVRGRGVSTKAPWFVKKVLHHFSMSTCLILIFSTDMSALDWCAFHCSKFSRRIDEGVWRIFFPDIIDIHILFVFEYVCGSYMDCFCCLTISTLATWRW